MSKAYQVWHKEIDGKVEDRETGYPDLHLELHPFGIELPPHEQQQELHISSQGGSFCTILDQKGLDELVDFLIEHIPGIDDKRIMKEDYDRAQAKGQQTSR